MKAIIIDDESRARQSLELLLTEFCPQVKVVALCENLPEGIKAIHKHKPDLVLLDIEMPGHSGLELLDFFEDKDVNFSIIFTTAYNEYALKAFKLSAIDYLLKPISPQELVEAINRVEKKSVQHFRALHENMHHERFEKIAVPDGSSYHVLNLADIVYIKGQGTYSEVHMMDKTKVMVSRNLKIFEELLVDNKNFVRSHKSYVVNCDKIKSFTKSDGGWVELTDGTSLPISTEKMSSIAEKINIVKR